MEHAAAGISGWRIKRKMWGQQAEKLPPFCNQEV